MNTEPTPVHSNFGTSGILDCENPLSGKITDYYLLIMGAQVPYEQT